MKISGLGFTDFVYYGVKTLAHRAFNFQSKCIQINISVSVHYVKLFVSEDNTGS